MRRTLDRIYEGALALACILLVVIAALVLFQVLGRALDRVLVALGQSPMGLTVPSLAEIGTFLFVASVFLGLAGTFQSGGHVRVTLLTQVLPDAVSRLLALAVAIGAAALSVFATWSSAVQTLDSWQFGSVSYGVIRIPLWLPQGAMTLGLALLLVAVLDAAFVIARGGTPSYATTDPIAAAEQPAEGGDL